MARLAIPIFGSRISPVFDSCTRVLIIDLDQDREIERLEMNFQGLSPCERVRRLQKSHVHTVICGAISNLLHTQLRSAHIEAVVGIAGDAEQVLEAFIQGHLHQARFHMPGYRGEAYHS